MTKSTYREPLDPYTVVQTKVKDLANNQSPIVEWGRHEAGGKMRAADGAKCFSLPPQVARKREENVGGNEE